MSSAALPENWPDRAYSQFVEAAGLRWHVSLRGSGPDLLLIHGTGASSHSWVPLARLLEDHFRIVALDLPGQGFTQMGSAEQCSLPGMSQGIASVLDALDITPRLIAGHSAGAAIASSLCLQGIADPLAVISINGAMLPFGSVAAPVFSRAAKVLSGSSVFTQIVALHAVLRKPVERMLRQTGSLTPPEMIRCYRELLGNSQHVAATLRMMANWDLSQLERNLDRLHPALYLMVCDNDLVLPPAQGETLARRVADSVLLRVPDLGHLGHEEHPQWFARQFLSIAGQHGL